MRRVVALVTLIPIIVATVASGAASAIALAAPATLGNSIFLVGLPDDPTIISICGGCSSSVIHTCHAWSGPHDGAYGQALPQG
jgi:hypothetical protein